MKGAGNYAQLIEEASKDATFLMILDRDFRDDGSVEDWEKRFNNRIFTWNCHELENLLLQDSEVLLKVSRFNGINKFCKPEDIEDALLEVARELEDLFVYQWAAFRLSNKTCIAPKGKPARPRDEKSFCNWVRERQNDSKNASEAYSELSVKSELATVRKEVKRCFETGEWKNLIPGKEILTRFRVEHIPGLQQEYFRNQVVGTMLESNLIPKEIDRLCEFIRRFQ